MEDLKAEMQKLSGGQTSVKRDFLLTLVTGLIKELPFRHSFTINIAKPIKELDLDRSMSDLIDGIFGYHIYLFMYEHPETGALIFVRDAVSDLYNYLENEGDPIKTKIYKGYLNS